MSLPPSVEVIKNPIKRLNFFPKYMHVKEFILLESYLYGACAEKMPEGYKEHSGFWDFWEVSDLSGKKAPIMVIDPEDKELYPLINPDNYFSGDVTKFVGGVAIYLFIINNFSFHYHHKKDERHTEAFCNIYEITYNWVMDKENTLFTDEDRSAILGFLN